MSKLYPKKFKNLVLYILSHDEYQDEGIKKLNKILYFIDFYFYRDNERFVSGKGIRYAKAGMGPLIDRYKAIFDQLQKEGILYQREAEGRVFHEARQKADISSFSPEEIDHIHNVLHRYGRLSSLELESISHEQQPWVLTEKDGDIIDPDLALLMNAETDAEEEIVVKNENLKIELTNLANAV